jgi:hypothetical protein
VQVEDFKPEAIDPEHQPNEGCLVAQFGAKGGRTLAQDDLAVIELGAQRPACPADEGDLISM